jgi:membrane fusion protein, macrolide-specific efflux system
MKSVLRRVRAHPWLSGLSAVVVVAAAGSGVYLGTRADPASAATTRTLTVSTGTVKQTVSATGAVAPAQQENLNFAVTGQVTSVAVSAGQTVKKGQALATINSASLAATEAQAEASVASLQANVDNDSSNGATSTQIAADNAALTAAENQLTSAKAQLAEATLTSPIDGVIAAVNLTVGQSVSGSTSSGGTGSSGTSGSGATGGAGGAAGGSSSQGNSGSSSTSSTTSPQILVITTNSWIVNATVDASSVGLIKANDQAQLTVTGATGTVYGTVSSIGLVSTSTTATASYPVVIDVTGTPSGMHDGANATASVIYKQVTGIVVPTTALHRNSGGGEYVEQVKNGKTVQTTVQVGIASGGQTQITSGLAPGDQILAPVPQATGGDRTGRTGGGTGGGQFPGGGTGGGQFPGGGFGGGGGFPGGGRFSGAGGGGG